MQITDYQIGNNRSNPSIPLSKLRYHGGSAQKVEFALDALPIVVIDTINCQPAGNVRFDNYHLFFILSRGTKNKKIKNIDIFMGLIPKGAAHINCIY